jgi:hypothetical protein
MPVSRAVTGEPPGRALSKQPLGESSFIEQKPAPTRFQLMRDLLDKSEVPVL